MRARGYSTYFIQGHELFGGVCLVFIQWDKLDVFGRFGLVAEGRLESV